MEIFLPQRNVFCPTLFAFFAMRPPFQHAGRPPSIIHHHWENIVVRIDISSIPILLRYTKTGNVDIQ